jgi:hypothetical protein
MRVEQLSVFLENKAGRLAEVTAVLQEAAINIRALAIADTSDFGVLRLIVDDTEKAEAALKAGGFTARRTAVVAVAVPDRPGGLHDILIPLRSEGINVEYMYAFVHHAGQNAVMIFRFEDNARAAQVLQKNGVRVIAGEEVYAL